MHETREADNPKLEAVEQPREGDRIQEQLNGLHDHLSGLRNRLFSFKERLVGPSTEETKGEGRPCPDGWVHQTEESLDMIKNVLEDCHYQMNEIERF